jgi:predicted SAM-dependent methyltransferase
MKLLNLGCGDRFKDGWVNIDFDSNHKSIKKHNLLTGIPEADNSFDVVYHSHIIEHFTKEQAAKFISECYRVLKPGGVLRISTPDLEEIINNYLNYLNKAIEGVENAEFRYDFTLLELIDQMVREKNGGALGELYKSGVCTDPDFVFERMSIRLKPSSKENAISTHHPSKPATLKQNIKRAIKFFQLKNFKDLLYKLLLFSDYKYYKLGKFRYSGECHLWLYDRFSLKRLLDSSGFKTIAIKNAFESDIQNWSNINLDLNEDGTIYKPHSIFIEGTK